jgi:hypothetical protein
VYHIGEPDAFVGQHRVDRCVSDRHEQPELAFGRPDLGDIVMKGADRTGQTSSTMLNAVERILGAWRQAVGRQVHPSRLAPMMRHHTPGPNTRSDFELGGTPKDSETVVSKDESKLV